MAPIPLSSEPGGSLPAERLAADKRARAGLVLERPLTGTEAGVERTVSHGSSGQLKKAVAAATTGLIDVEDFLARTHLVVMPSPEEAAVELLAGRLGLPPASCVAHQAILRGRLARLADENGVRTAKAPAALSVGDIARLLDNVSEAIDPSALEEAVRQGVAELSTLQRRSTTSASSPASMSSSATSSPGFRLNGQRLSSWPTRWRLGGSRSRWGRRAPESRR
jgi:hypothetical protein